MKYCPACKSKIKAVGANGTQFECGSIVYGHSPDKLCNVTESCKLITKQNVFIEEILKKSVKIEKDRDYLIRQVALDHPVDLARLESATSELYNQIKDQGKSTITSSQNDYNYGTLTHEQYKRPLNF